MSLPPCEGAASVTLYSTITVPSEGELYAAARARRDTEDEPAVLVGNQPGVMPGGPPPESLLRVCSPKGVPTKHILMHRKGAQQASRYSTRT
jgi:hypothetical protein